MDKTAGQANSQAATPCPPDVRMMVQKELEAGTAEFDKLFPGKSEEFALRISDVFANLSRSAERLKDRYGEDKRNTNEWKGVAYSWMLLGNAANALIAGFVLLRKGYLQEPFAIGRVAMERLMSAVILHDNPEIVSEFETGKQEKLYEKGVGAVSKVINGFGKMWGTLSSPGTHVSRQNITSILVSGEKGANDAIRIGGHFGMDDVENKARRAALDHYAAMADLLKAAPEQIFFNGQRKKATLPPKKRK